jgi:hypothetical protein
LQLTSGEVSVTAVDAVNQNVVFEQMALRELDWRGLASHFNRFASDQVIALPALEALKMRAAFLRGLFERRFTSPDGRPRVLIVVSGSMLFERGSDLAAVKVEGKCNCRVFHLRMRLPTGDSFDHVERLLRPLRPRTFDIESALDFREALGKIVRELEAL